MDFELTLMPPKPVMPGTPGSPYTASHPGNKSISLTKLNENNLRKYNAAF